MIFKKIKNAVNILNLDMNKFLYSIIVFLLIFVGIAIYYIGIGDLTSRENVMLSILLTILSTLASLVTSHLYAKYQYQKDVEEIKKEYQSNLRTYALKASEKVDNLSNELIKLSLYMQEEFDSENDDLKVDNLSKKETLKSSIHIVNTLKSVNDKSLSDWQGVIPEEIDEREQVKKAEQIEIVGLLEKLKSLEDRVDENKDENLSEIRSDIKNLQKHIDFITITKLGISPLKRTIKNKKPTKNTVQNNCPSCNKSIEYKQRPTKNSYKEFKCSECNINLISRWNEIDGYSLYLNEEVQEKINCTNCNNPIILALLRQSGSIKIVTCSNCHGALKIVRFPNKIEIEPIFLHESIGQNNELTDILIQKVKAELPEQPWPKGTSKSIATKLELSKNKVSKIIQILIDKKEFKKQVNGVLYD